MIQVAPKRLKNKSLHILLKTRLKHISYLLDFVQHKHHPNSILYPKFMPSQSFSQTGKKSKSKSTFYHMAGHIDETWQKI